MIDELFDVGFKIARQVVVFQQDAVLERLMPAFDLALCLRMVGSDANVPHVLCIQPLSQVRRDVTGTIIAQQAWLTDDPRPHSLRPREQCPKCPSRPALSSSCTASRR